MLCILLIVNTFKNESKFVVDTARENHYIRIHNNDQVVLIPKLDILKPNHLKSAISISFFFLLWFLKIRKNNNNNSTFIAPFLPKNICK